MAKLLIIEDDVPLAESVAEWLSRDGHMVEHAATGEDGLQLLKSFEFEIVLLDWTLPGITGLEVCGQYRRSGGKAWMIFLTGQGSMDYKERGLEVGADDYLVKPFDMRELRARIKSGLRRADAHYQPTLQIGDVSFDLSTRNCVIAEHTIHLSVREAALMDFLMRNCNRHFSAKTLLAAVWPSDTEVSEGVVRTTMVALRTKLKGVGRDDLVKTASGSGYYIECKP